MQREKPATAQEQIAAEVSLTDVYAQFRQPIYAYIYRLLGSREDADDSTQEVFVRACALWETLTDREHLSPWLYRLATNICLDALRRRKRVWWRSLGPFFRSRSVSDEEQEIAFLSSHHGGIPEVAERELISLALKQLTPEQAVVLVLYSVQGLTYQQVAEVISVSPQVAATRISRARKKFMRAYTILSQDDAGKRGKEHV
jgi:RNA polymerase sigma-70 factor (ECF subfamily)